MAFKLPSPHRPDGFASENVDMQMIDFLAAVNTSINNCPPTVIKDTYLFRYCLNSDKQLPN
jgi:hypothetical protein